MRAATLVAVALNGLIFLPVVPPFGRMLDAISRLLLDGAFHPELLSMPPFFLLAAANILVLVARHSRHRHGELKLILALINGMAVLLCLVIMLFARQDAFPAGRVVWATFVVTSGVLALQLIRASHEDHREDPGKDRLA